MSLNSQAQELNSTIAEINPAVADLLSPRGKAIFFPKMGILSQSADAAGKAINATIGIAKEDSGKPMCLESIAKNLNLPVGKAFPYASSYGLPEIRSLWKKQQIEKNPGLANAAYSTPVVTNALTHSLSIAGFLFADDESPIILPDLYWENYDLTFSISYGSRLQTYTTFTADGGFNVAGLRETLAQNEGKVLVLLNFPNNPTGYTPTNREAEAITSVLTEAAADGKKLVVLIDDAYFGLVFEEGVYTQSMFSKLCNAHENLLAVKMDGPTKEDYVWGFRVGFLSFGIKKGTEALYKALEAKAAGAVRGTISNASHPGQSLLIEAWSSGNYTVQKKEKFHVLKARYDKIKAILAAHPEYAERFLPLPFNSGYFMCVRLKGGDAESIRQRLLADFSTGVIAFDDIIRLAFSSMPLEKLGVFFDNLYRAAG